MHVCASQRIERAEWLVGKQELRVTGERAGEGCALLLASREVGWPGALAAAQADLRERMHGAPARITPGKTELDILQHASPRKQPRILKGD